jgi:hypothetical protein
VGRVARWKNKTNNVHGDGHHFAVSEIDDAHNAENHRESERHQAVDKGGQYPADGGIGIDLPALINSAMQLRSRARRVNTFYAVQPRLS